MTEEKAGTKDNIEESVEVKAIAKYIRVSPFKAREVMGLVRGKDIEEAFKILEFCPKAAARKVKKVLHSAVNNAEKNHALQRQNLYIVRAFVDGGPVMKRFRPRAMGRASMIHHKTSHITMVVKERKEN